MSDEVNVKAVRRLTYALRSHIAALSKTPQAEIIMPTNTDQRVRESC